jgi:FlaA1/EpsC-like NDP-sugar epimerase
MYQDKIVLITGAGGTLGQELVKHLLLRNPKKIKALGHSEKSIYNLMEEVNHNKRIEPILTDIRDIEGMRKASVGVDYIIHCAAVKSIDVAQHNAIYSLKTNIDGVINVARCVLESPTIRKMMFISSDKSVYPITLYGATKLIGEYIMEWSQNQTKDKVFCSTRNGNFYKSNMSAMSLWEKQAKDGKPLTVTHPDMKRYFIEIENVAKFVLDRLEEAKGGEIYIPGPSMLKEKRILDMANEISKNHVYIGLRPHEKFAEKLWMDEEKPEFNGEYYTIR